MNKSLLIDSRGSLEWREVPRQEPGPAEVQVEVLYGAVKHGTEFSMARGYPARRGPWNEELRLHEKTYKEESSSFFAGNMVAGKVAALGTEVQDLDPGETVFGYAHFAEFVSIPRGRLWRMPGVDWRSALCLDPARFALAALRDSGIRIGDTVAVFGLGAIGLICIRLAVISGAARVIAVDPLEPRRSASLMLGASEALDPTAEDAGRRLKLLTRGRGVDAAVEVSGSSQALQEALRGIAFGGTVVCGAFPPPYPAGLDLGAEAHMNCPQILFSRATSDPNGEQPRWDATRIEEECLLLIAQGRIQGSSIIDRVVPFDDLREEYELTMKNPSRSIKLGVVFPAAGSGQEG